MTLFISCITTNDRIDKHKFISFTGDFCRISLSHNSTIVIIKQQLLSSFPATVVRNLSFSLRIVGFLADEIGGDMTHNVRPKIIGGQAVDVKYRPFMVQYHFLAMLADAQTICSLAYVF